jgi:hypothetical protein
MIDIISLCGTVTTATLAYLAWQRSGFPNSADIEQQAVFRLNNDYIYNRVDFQHQFAEIAVTETGFPSDLLKYIPTIERRGFADVRISLRPKDDVDRMRLPPLEDISEDELLQNEVVELRGTV